MRKPSEVEQYRIKTGPMASIGTIGRINGAFLVPYGKITLRVIASDGLGWEHVSVSLANRCPTWEEIDYVKNVFWTDDEAVMQLHVPKDRHVNWHPFCLHMWKPLNEKIPLPPKVMVGPG